MEFVAALHRWVPETRLYRHDDGRFVAITVTPMGPAKPWLDSPMGRIPVDPAHIVARPTLVHLCDASGVAIDADGDAATGLTPLLTLDVGLDFDAACAIAATFMTEMETT